MKLKMRIAKFVTAMAVATASVLAFPGAASADSGGCQNNLQVRACISWDGIFQINTDSYYMGTPPSDCEYDTQIQNRDGAVISEYVNGECNKGWNRGIGADAFGSGGLMWYIGYTCYYHGRQDADHLIACAYSKWQTT
ncbi:hypothetical protein [Streptomyces sp. NBC_00079]|uniref:hypothetical protein n=1 Tax=Streptomyces sp. NBC_00079 TaxID=2975644 RepID=UPI0032522616